MGKLFERFVLKVVQRKRCHFLCYDTLNYLPAASCQACTRDILQKIDGTEWIQLLQIVCYLVMNFHASVKIN